MPTFLAIAIGTGAALGFALKHYFLMVPAALELWLQLGPWVPPASGPSGDPGQSRQSGAAYAAALLIEGDYLARMVPWVRLAYGQFGPRAIHFLFNPYLVIGAGLFAFTAAHARLLFSRSSSTATALFVAGLAFAATYFIQFEGGPSHHSAARLCVAGTRRVACGERFATAVTAHFNARAPDAAPGRIGERSYKSDAGQPGRLSGGRRPQLGR